MTHDCICGKFITRTELIEFMYAFNVQTPFYHLPNEGETCVGMHAASCTHRTSIGGGRRRFEKMPPSYGPLDVTRSDHRPPAHERVARKGRCEGLPARPNHDRCCLDPCFATRCLVRADLNYLTSVIISMSSRASVLCLCIFVPNQHILYHLPTRIHQRELSLVKLFQSQIKCIF